MNDYSNMVLLDKRDLFDAVRGALKEQMEALPFGDAADLWAEATSAADECLRDLVSKAPMPPAGDVPEYFVAACDKFDWTPEEALRFYAEGKHFDTVDGRTRILCTGAIASHALKGLAGPYADMKGMEPAGDVEVLASLGLTLAVLNEAFNAQDSAQRLANMDVPRVIRSAFKEFERVKTEVTRLTAERDGLATQCGGIYQQLEICRKQRDQRQSELTKARELFNSLLDEDEGIPAAQEASDGFVWHALHRAQDLIRAYLAATPVAHNVDESCGQDAEAAKGGA